MDTESMLLYREHSWLLWLLGGLDFGVVCPLALGEKACRATEFKDPMLLDTLAAAYAEAGRFQEAVNTAQRGIELATGARDHGLQEKLRSRLELYQSQRPYRMNP